MQFNLTNVRAGVKFVYYTNGTSYPVRVASFEDVVNFRNLNEPLRVRITATGNPDVLNVTWSSNHSSSPVLLWGTERGHYTHTAYGSTRRLLRSEMCGYPANGRGWRDLGEIYTASLDGLLSYAGTTLYYVCGDESVGQYSKEYSFRVPPAPGTQPPDRPTTIALFQDLGYGSLDSAATWGEYNKAPIYTVMALGDEVVRGNIDAVFHGGDISYANGCLAVWDFFLVNFIFPAMQKTCLSISFIII